MMYVNAPSILRAQEMSVFPFAIDFEAEARFAGIEFPPSPFWVSLPSSLR